MPKFGRQDDDASPRVVGFTFGAPPVAPPPVAAAPLPPPAAFPPPPPVAAFPPPAPVPPLPSNPYEVPQAAPVATLAPPGAPPGWAPPAPFTPYAPAPRSSKLSAPVAVVVALAVLATGAASWTVLKKVFGAPEISAPQTLGGYAQIDNPVLDAMLDTALEENLKGRDADRAVAEIYGQGSVPRVMMIAIGTRSPRSSRTVFQDDSESLRSGQVTGVRDVVVPGEAPVTCGTMTGLGAVCAWGGKGRSEGMVAVYGAPNVEAAAGVAAEARASVNG